MALTLVFVAPLLSAVDAGLDPRSYRQRSAEAATCHEERTEDEGDRWDAEILPTLTDYIRIPAKSPMFDAKWREHGHLDRAVALVRGWSENQPIEGLRVEVVRLEGRTPLIVKSLTATGARPRAGRPSRGRGGPGAPGWSPAADR